ncbi:SGNH/GDSL hydrolase family protein [Magnetospirillum sulfuroxidans]|uniref:SGNH/GDSL hydrolase family protein n=1 Tax=Magnetospirillum sulfuroxidans TaxID=611300 RepID=A0ABS5I6T8_9PROT|nr:SGNH/GDSL hydrolase family protein [Magnetospirillum sulfuroxidans]MBR9970132.1 SGNH/GDSL hydrolase family protein [Magnetospirillum sulfuroxidans]
MRRRRSRHHTESNFPAGAFGTLPRLVLLLAVLLPVAEWGASLIINRVDASSRAVKLSDKDIAKLYDSAEPGRYREVLEETPQSRDGIYAPLIEYRMPARQGKHVTVSEGGIRGGVIGDAGARVAVFGGGSVFGHGLADGETIPAVVAATLSRNGKAARVENRGVPGWYSTQDRVAFAEMLATGDKPDVAVFVHGLDDFLHCSKPERTAWSHRLALADIPVSVETLVRQSALASLFRGLFGIPEPGRTVELEAECVSDAQVESSLARLDANRRLISAMAERFGVKVLFVQQPVPTFHYDNAKRALPLRPEQMAPYVATAKAYARLAEMRGTGKLWEQDMLWLAELEPAEGNAYIDPVHYSPVFAKLIGETMAKRVGDMLPGPLPEAVSPVAVPAAQ